MKLTARQTDGVTNTILGLPRHSVFLVFGNDLQIGSRIRPALWQEPQNSSSITLNKEIPSNGKISH
jgi:hypothetical protein